MPDGRNLFSAGEQWKLNRFLSFTLSFIADRYDIMIEFTLEGKRLICRINQEIVASKIPEMRNTLSAYLDNHQNWDTMIFDCARVNTLDSIGVNFIVGAYKKVHSLERQFKLVGCNETVAKVLKLFKLDEKFEVEPAVGLKS